MTHLKRDKSSRKTITVAWFSVLQWELRVMGPDVCRLNHSVLYLFFFLTTVKPYTNRFCQRVFTGIRWAQVCVKKKYTHARTHTHRPTVPHRCAVLLIREPDTQRVETGLKPRRHFVCVCIHCVRKCLSFSSQQHLMSPMGSCPGVCHSKTSVKGLKRLETQIRPPR